MNKIALYLSLLITVSLSFQSCDLSSDIKPTDDDSTNIESHESDDDYSWNNDSNTIINLQSSSITITGSGASASGSIATITKAGYYDILGELNDGQIIVDAPDTATIYLKLDNATIHCESNPAIYIKDADKVIISLADGSVNTLSDGSSYDSEEDANATLFSKTNLTIYGSGKLIVNSHYNDGITSKDGLIITSGTYVVNAIDDAIRGKDYLIIKEGTFELITGGDGLKSDNEETGAGYISIETCECTINALGDAIQACNNLTIKDGIYSITCMDGYTSYLANTISAKSLKAGANVKIDGGTFDINTPDDAIHSNNTLTINNGDFSIASGDDAIHADISLEINDGTFEISNCYEGIESAAITINGGNIVLHASDDGINAADGSGESGPGMSVGSCTLTINGGFIAVYANGDGIDINGSGQMTDGTLLVHGPTSNGNGPFDYDGTFKMDGGIAVAAGSSGMAQMPSTSSSQASTLFYLSSTFSGGTLFNLQSADGEEIVTFRPSKNYASIVISSPKISTGTSYLAYYNGSHSGTETYGLYSNGEYISGVQYTSFTQSALCTKVGNGGGGPGMR